MNKCHTPTRPCKGVFRGSCTSNVPTEEAFERGLDILRRLVLECRNLERARGTYDSLPRCIEEPLLLVEAADDITLLPCMMLRAGISHFGFKAISHHGCDEDLILTKGVPYLEAEEPHELEECGYLARDL